MAALLLAGSTSISGWFAFFCPVSQLFFGGFFVLKIQFYAQEEAWWEKIINSSLEICGHAELLDPGALNLMTVIVFIPVKIGCSCKCERDERELLLGY